MKSGGGGDTTKVLFRKNNLDQTSNEYKILKHIALDIPCRIKVSATLPWSVEKHNEQNSLFSLGLFAKSNAMS